MPLNPVLQLPHLLHLVLLAHLVLLVQSAILRQDLLLPSNTHTTCGWKGIASYHDVVAGGKVNTDAAWYYPAPKGAADNIKDRIAFWKGVKVVAD